MRFAITALMVLGCGSVEDAKLSPPPPPIRPYCTQPQIAGGFTPYADCVFQPEQGRHILGRTADTLAIDGMNLAIALNGARLRVTSAGTFLVDGAAPSDGSQFPTIPERPPTIPQTPKLVFAISGSANAYTVHYGPQGTNASAWPSLCEDDELAYAIEGQWSSGGQHIPTPNTVTFSCDKHGKAAWCVKLGYIPSTANTTDPTSDPRWGMNQACVRMATGDYCANGQFHTRELTPIEVLDSLGIQYDASSYYLPTAPLALPVFPEPPQTMYREAVWPSDGGAAVCLAKYRWVEMPEGYCPQIDPRRTMGAHYCEDFDLDLYAQSNPYYIVNGSRVMDVALHTWSNTSNSDSIMSVNGVSWSGRTKGTPAYPNLVAPPNGTNEGFMLRSLTGTLQVLPPAGTPLDPNRALATPVYRVVNTVTGDGVAVPAWVFDPRLGPILDPTKFQTASGTQLPVPGLTESEYEADPNFEGFLIDHNYPGQTLTLTLYRNGPNFVTGTYAPADAPSGFTKVVELGSIIGSGP